MAMGSYPWHCYGNGIAMASYHGIAMVIVCTDDDMSIGLALNKESKYKRNIAHFGPTTLRSTIAYGLLR